MGSGQWHQQKINGAGKKHGAGKIGFEAPQKKRKEGEGKHNMSTDNYR